MLQLINMCDRPGELLEAMRTCVRKLDVSSMTGGDAEILFELFSEIDRLATAARTIALARVQETRAWRMSGAPSPTAWMAIRAGTTLAAAADALQTATRVRDLPATKEAMVSGLLSETQANEITAAASVDPSAEEKLLELSQHGSVAALREKCRDVRAAASGDEDATERIRRGRFLKHWTDRDGALRLDARLAPDDGAPLIAAVRARADRLEREARRLGPVEPTHAYAADALVSLVDGKGSPKAVVQVVVSDSALERGHTVSGETCRIEGVGSISVQAAERLLRGGTMKVIESKGVDVGRVAHAGRIIPSRLRTALEARDPTCVVPGCNRRRGLEIDHIVPYAQGGPTKLDNLARLCRWHHAQKTHHGWRLEGSPGTWRWQRGPKRARAPDTS